MVKLKPEVGGDQIKVEVNDRKNGTYLAEYTVDKLYGKLTLSVCLRGVHIKDSPFSVLVEPLNLPQYSLPVTQKLALPIQSSWPLD